MSNNGGIVKNIQGAQQVPLRTYEYVSNDNTAEIGMLGGLASKLIDLGGDYAAAKAKAQGSKQKDYSPYMQAAQETRDYLESANVSPSDKRARMDELQSFYGPYYTPAEMKSMNEAVGLDKSITGIIEPAQQAEIDYTANIEKSIRDEATKAFPGLSPQDAETAWYLNQQNVSDISNIAAIESKMTPEQRRYYRGNKEYAIQNYIGNAFSSALGELEKTNNLNENTVYTVAKQITANLEGLGVDSSWANQQVQAQIPKWVSIAKEDVKYRESSLKDQQNMYALSLMPDQESFAKETFEVEIGGEKTTTTGAAVMRGEKDAPKLMEVMYTNDPKFRLAVFQSFMTRSKTGNAEEATKSVRNSPPMSADATASALKNLQAFTGKLFAMPEGNVKEAGKDAVNKTVESALKISSKVEEGRVRPDGRPEMYLGLSDTLNSQAPNNGYKNSDYYKSNAEEILKGLSANFYKSIGESRVVLLDPSGRAKMINVEISGDKYRYTDVSDNEDFRRNFSVRISEMIDDMVRVGGLSREGLIKDFNRVALMDSPLGNAMYRHFTGEVNPTSVWADQTADALLSGKTNFNLWNKLEYSWLGDAMESAYTNVKEGTVGLVKGGARSVRDVARGVLEYGKTPDEILQEQRESGRVPPPQPNRPFMTDEERKYEAEKEQQERVDALTKEQRESGRVPPPQPNKPFEDGSYTNTEVAEVAPEGVFRETDKDNNMLVSVPADSNIQSPIEGSVVANATGKGFTTVVIQDPTNEELLWTIRGRALDIPVTQGTKVKAGEILGKTTKDTDVSIGLYMADSSNFFGGETVKLNVTALQRRGKVPPVQPVPSSRKNTSASNFEYKGNIDLENRPVVTNEDGSVSTELSIVIEEDGKFAVIPTVVNGEVVSEEKAIEHYHRSGKHLGVYSSLREAEKASRAISQTQAERYLK